MSQSCQRCNKTYNGPEAFLLTCRGCRKTWHHRCLMPPMEDQVLIQLIRAKNAGDAANDLDSWTCRRCKKRGSETPSGVSTGREQTASSEDSKSWSSGRSLHVRDSTSVTSAASTVDARVKRELSTTVDLPLVHDRGGQKTDRPESTETAPVKHTFAAKKTTSSTATRSHAQPQPDSSDVNVQIAGALKGFLPQRPSKTHPVRAARKLDNTFPIASESEVAMQVDPPSFSESTSSATSEREEQARPAVEAAIQPPASQVAADEYDDPEDLYGPPVEHRIVRILPALAEELREQQRRVNISKSPLAPDWILARHADDPSWKEIPVTQGRKRGKPATTRKLGENGLDVNELVGCFTVQDWVREHKERA